MALEFGMLASQLVGEAESLLKYASIVNVSLLHSHRACKVMCD